jgi:hypothetical protein
MKSRRNTLAGKHPSYERLNMSEDRKRKKLEYDKEYQSTDARKKYRAKLNKANRDAGTYGNKDGKDMSHTRSGRLVLESARSNRARNGQSGRSTKR